MIASTINKFGKTLYILYPGDYFATDKNCVLGTVTGACVVVCLHDKARKIGGLGHFIVPGAIGTQGILKDEIASQGIMNMEYLMGEIVKLGGDRRDLIVKLFGAGYMAHGNESMGGVVESNIKFLEEYCNLENIPIEKKDLGGNFRRKIYFHPDRGTVYRKLLSQNEQSSEFVKMEKEYIDQVFNNKKRAGRLILFE